MFTGVKIVDREHGRLSTQPVVTATEHRPRTRAANTGSVYRA